MFYINKSLKHFFKFYIAWIFLNIKVIVKKD